ncbi:hypothetical protein ACLBOM_27385 [Escherichia coli]
MQAQQALLNAEIDQQRKSLEGNTVLQDTLQKQRDYVTANSARLEHRSAVARSGKQQAPDFN